MSADNMAAGGQGMTTEEIDAIGEIMNISMGSAATAASTMLDRQVVITTPNVQVQSFDSVDYSSLEPAIVIRIQYVEGISGTNLMVFRQHDMQIILNLLMGNEEEPSDEFEFDELSISAACEVMNQMMGAAATALSEILGRSINISTPDAELVKSKAEVNSSMDGIQGDEDIVSIAFDMKIGRAHV